MPRDRALRVDGVVIPRALVGEVMQLLRRGSSYSRAQGTPVSPAAYQFIDDLVREAFAIADETADDDTDIAGCSFSDDLGTDNDHEPVIVTSMHLAAQTGLTPAYVSRQCKLGVIPTEGGGGRGNAYEIRSDDPQVVAWVRAHRKAER